MHRDADAAIFVGHEQILRKPFCFGAKHEKIIALKSRSVIKALTLCCQKKVIRIRRLRPLQGVEGIPQLQAHFAPVIQPRSFQLPMIQRKAKRLDQMQSRFCGQTKPTDVACVWRYLRPNQDDVKHLLFLFRCVLSSSHLQSIEGEEQIKEENATICSRRIFPASPHLRQTSEFLRPFSRRPSRCRSASSGTSSRRAPVSRSSLTSLSPK